MYTVGGNVDNPKAVVKSSLEVPPKIKHRTTTRWWLRW